MVVIRVFFAVSIILSLVSCYLITPSKIKNGFSYCYNSESKYKNDKIKFNGYFIIKIPPYSVTEYNPNTHSYFETKRDTSFMTMIFFEDGMYVEGALNDINNKAYTDYENLRYISNSRDLKSLQFYRFGSWGLYKIVGDTLKTQTVFRGAMPTPFYEFSEMQFLFINGMKILQIVDKNSNQSTKNGFVSEMTYDFVETNINLSSDYSWLKNEKWFWCDKEQYKKWKLKNK